MSKDVMAVPVEKARKKTYNEMTKATREVADQFQELLTRGARGSILVQYDLGSRLGAVIEDEATYGSGAVKQLAEYFNIKGGETTLYSLRNFAGEFEKTFVDKWSSQLMANGDYMTTNHWFHLMKIKDKAGQEKMLRRVFAESMSSNDLEKEVRSGSGGATKNTRQGGRKPRVPSNPIVGLDQTFSIAQRLNNFDKVATASVFDALDEWPADKITKDLLKRLEKTHTTVEVTHAKTGKMLERLSTNIARVKRILSKGPSANGKAAGATAGAGKKKKKKKKPEAVAVAS